VEPDVERPHEILTEAMLDRMRTIGLRMDRSGTFWHEGTAVTHPRLRQALLRWLDVRDDGRDIVRLDDQRYADRETELDYGSLRQAADHALYARIHDRLRGRIAGPAYHAVAERIVEIPEDAGFALDAAGHRWPIADAA
jgi:hypothetical protein